MPLSLTFCHIPEPPLKYVFTRSPRLSRRTSGSSPSHDTGVLLSHSVTLYFPRFAGGTCPHFARDRSSSLRTARIRYTGGKGTPRRKVVKKSQSASQGDDRKIQAVLKKLSVTAVSGVEEVNMFKEDGNVLHFQAPRGES